jgi:transposase
MTCWRRLREWQQAGVWTQVHHALMQRLPDAGRIVWERASLASASVPAPAGGEATGKDPTNRGKLGTKRHIVVDSNGLPLAVTVSGSNVHDSMLLEATVDAILPLRLPDKRRGRPRKRPVKLHADKVLRLPALSADAALAGHHPAHRPARHRIE